MARVRTVASVSTSGSSDHRPATVAGADRATVSGREPPRRPPSVPREPVRPAYRVERGPEVARLCAVRPPASRARTGVKVSPETWPDQTSDQRSSTTSVSLAFDGVGQGAEEVGAAARRARRGRPAPGRRARRRRARSSSGARVSARWRETQPSSPGSDPWPRQTTSPDAHQLVEHARGSSRRPGRAGRASRGRWRAGRPRRAARRPG